MPSNFIFEKNGPITTITFSRPERRNCLNEEVIFDFENLLHSVRDDRETRALIVTGTGTAFCSGADLSVLKNAENREQQPVFSKQAGKRMPRLIGRVFDVLANLDLVTIGAINGYAVGGGWSWALAFDFCLAVETVLGARGRHAGALSRRAGQGSRRTARSVAREGSDPHVPSLQSCGAAGAWCHQSNGEARGADAGRAGTGAHDGVEAGRGDCEFQARHQRRVLRPAAFLRLF
jgi:1,4-dihydroxy-2-naphthoyl-CoA synthase